MSATKVHDIKILPEDVPDKTDPPPPASPEYQYATTTTLHGLNKIADAGRLLVRVTWLCVVICCLGLLCYQIIMLIIDYRQFQPNTAISVKVSKRQFSYITC